MTEATTKPCKSEDLTQQERLVLATGCMRSGRLPETRSSQVLAGSGSGECCEICELAIEADEVAYEVVDLHSHAEPLSFHRVCYDAWVIACLSAS
jgi:hypothetical protein